jgi:lipopolysaccharide/colanic/teichoic acid biosynthesis glycosyltransferase
LDIAVSGFGLVVSLPLWVVIAAAIKLGDGGAVFYRQTRLGRLGKTFDILKFRSMVPNAERLTGPVWATENDARVTPVGRVLRATAMDELPQLFNIFRGQMSFVGPRPERPELVAKFRQEIGGYDRRFAVTPGLTGLAQIFGKYDSTPRQKLRYDLLYTRRQSVWLDIRLISLSVWITLRGKWEHRERKVPMARAGSRRRRASRRSTEAR